MLRKQPNNLMVVKFWEFILDCILNTPCPPRRSHHQLALLLLLLPSPSPDRALHPRGPMAMTVFFFYMADPEVVCRTPLLPLHPPRVFNQTLILIRRILLLPVR